MRGYQRYIVAERRQGRDGLYNVVLKREPPRSTSNIVVPAWPDEMVFGPILTMCLQHGIDDVFPIPGSVVVFTLDTVPE